MSTLGLAICRLSYNGPAICTPEYVDNLANTLTEAAREVRRGGAASVHPRNQRASVVNDTDRVLLGGLIDTCDKFCLSVSPAMIMGPL